MFIGTATPISTKGAADYELQYRIFSVFLSNRLVIRAMKYLSSRWPNWTLKPSFAWFSWLPLRSSWSLYITHQSFT